MRRHRYKFIGRSDGFSLLEIMLVLAISSALVIAIFQAFSFGQKIRRDNQRKEVLHIIADNLEKLKASTNYGSRYPSDSNDDKCDGGGHSIFHCLFDPSATNGSISGPTGNDISHAYAVSGSKNLDPLTGTAYTYGGVSIGGDEVNLNFIPTKSPAKPSLILYRLGWPCSATIVGVDSAGAGYNPGVYRLEINLEDGVVYCLDNH